MNYTDAFVIDSIAYNNREETNIEPYTLNNFDYYKPKLVNDFYLKYFTRELLFEIDILEVEDFLDYHYSESSNPNMLVKILKQKILPIIKTVISKAVIDLSGGRAFEQKKLEDGFIESQGVISKPEYELHHLFHMTEVNLLQEDLEERWNQIKGYISKVDNLNSNKNQNILKWKGKPSHLALIVRELIQQGFIEPPKLSNKEINLTELSREMNNSFFHESSPNIDTYRRYLDVNSVKHQNLKESFTKNGFIIPDSGLVS